MLHMAGPNHLSPPFGRTHFVGSKQGLYLPASVCRGTINRILYGARNERDRNCCKAELSRPASIDRPPLDKSVNNRLYRGKCKLHGVLEI